MSYSMYGAAAAVVLVAGVGAYSAMDRAANYKPAKASVYLIDRKCDIVAKTTGADGKKSTEIYNDDCNSIAAWDNAKAKRDKSISGKAVVKVSYTAPQDGSYHTSELSFTSRDDEFYDLKAGDEIELLVSNSDPSKVRKS
jgi:hypothetical protein